MISLVLLVNILLLFIAVPVVQYNGCFTYDYLNSPKLISQHNIPMLSDGNEENLMEIIEAHLSVDIPSAIESLFKNLPNLNSTIDQLHPPTFPKMNIVFFEIAIIFIGISVLISYCITCITWEKEKEKEKGAKIFHLPLLLDESDREIDHCCAVLTGPNTTITNQLRDLRKTVESLSIQHRANAVKDHNFRKETKEFMTIYRETVQAQSTRIESLVYRVSKIEKKIENLSLEVKKDCTEHFSFFVELD